MRTVYVIEKRQCVHGDAIEPGAVTAWVMEHIYDCASKARDYVQQRNANPCSLCRRAVRKYVN